MAGRLTSRTNDAHFGSIRQLIFDPTFQELISLGEDDCNLRIFNLPRLSLSSAHDLPDFDSHHLKSISFLTPTELLLSGENGQLLSLDWPNCRSLTVLYKHFTSIDFISPHRHGLIAFSSNRSIFLLKNSEAKTIFETQNEILFLNFTPTADILVVFQRGGLLIGIDINSNMIISECVLSQSVCIPSFNEISDLITINSGKIQIFQFAQGGDSVSLTIPEMGQITAVAGTTSHIAICDENNDIVIGDFNDFAVSQKLSGSNSSIIRLVWGKGSLAAGDEGGRIHFWNAIFQIDEPERELHFATPKHTLENAFNKPIPNRKPKNTKITKPPIAKPKSIKDFQRDEETIPEEHSRARDPAIPVGLSDELEPDLHFPKPKHPLQAAFNKPIPNRKPKNTKINKPPIAKPKSIKDFQRDEETIPEEHSRARDPAPAVSFSSDETDELDPKPKRPLQDTFTAPIPTPTIRTPPLPTAANFKDFPDDDETISEGPFPASDDTDELESESAFSARIQTIAPPPLPMSSETSSDHDIDLDEFDAQEPDDNPDAAASASSSSSTEDLDLDLGELYRDLTFPFMPGSSEEFIGNRRYLCWNDSGAIFLRQDPTEPSGYSIDLQFADGRERSLPSLGYEFASLDQHGYVIASPSEVLYCHLATWAPDGSTTISFARRHEAIRLVACGEDWFAIATDLPCIRIFSSAGLELAVLMLPLSVVVMVGRDNFLFYAVGSQLEFALLDISNRREIAHGMIAVSQPLKWVGIGTDLTVICLDYHNFVLRLSRDFDWQWVPVLHLEDPYDPEVTGFWLVYGGDGDSVFGVPLRGTKSPSTYPMPSCKQFAVAPQTFDTKVRQWLAVQMDASLGHRCAAKQKDRELIKLFPEAMKEQQELRAVELAGMLRTKQFREFVVPFADRQGYAKIGDRLTGEVSEEGRRSGLQWKPVEVRESGRRSAPIRTNSEETVYVRRPVELPEGSAAKPAGLVDALQKLKQSKSTSEKVAPVSAKRKAGGRFRPLFS